jgi:serine/threonine-protein kinase RsbW
MEDDLPKKSITFIIESRLQNIGLVGVAVKAICESIPIGAIICRNIELSVVEAVTNVVKHAYSLQQENIVEIVVHVFGDRISIKISDTGLSMDPRRCEQDCQEINFQPGNIETFPVGGMGLHIMHSIMDEMHYSTVSGKNTMTLVKKF